MIHWKPPRQAGRRCSAEKNTRSGASQRGRPCRAGRSEPNDTLSPFYVPFLTAERPRPSEHALPTCQIDQQGSSQNFSKSRRNLTLSGDLKSLEIPKSAHRNSKDDEFDNNLQAVIITKSSGKRLLVFRGDASRLLFVRAAMLRTEVRRNPKKRNAPRGEKKKTKRETDW